MRGAGDVLETFPHQGGQLQRIVPGTLILRPKLIVADEPVSMRDVSVRAGIPDARDRGEPRPRRGHRLPRPRAGALCRAAHAMYLATIVEGRRARGLGAAASIYEGTGRRGAGVVLDTLCYSSEDEYERQTLFCVPGFIRA